MICGNKVGGKSCEKTYLITNADNTIQVQAVVVEDYTAFTACAADVASGKTFACDGGVATGTNTCPKCRVAHGTAAIEPNQAFKLTLAENDMWDYTILYATISAQSSPYYVEKVVMNNIVYGADGSNIATVTKNAATDTIQFNITNDSASTYLISYFICKEEA